MTNSSNTTPTMIGSGVVAAGGLAAFSHPAAILAVLGGGMANNLMARAWTSPKFVNLITGFVKAANSGSDGAVKSQIGRLNKLAATNPELREAVESVIRNIANDNTPNAGAVAASPNEGPQNQAQPY
jgi:flagellar motor component MotA